MARKKIPLIDETATLNVTGAVSLAGAGTAVITFPSVTSTLATTADLALKVDKTVTINTKVLSANVVLNPDDLDDTATLHKFTDAAGITAIGTIASKAPSASPAFTGLPTAPTPTANDNSTKIATTTYVEPYANQSLYRQAIINGNFDVWQRGTSFASSGIKFSADRFVFFRQGGGTGLTISRQLANLSGSQYCVRVQRDSGNIVTNGNAFFYNTIESNTSIKFAGQPITISFYARSGTNYSSTSSILNLITNTGTGTDETYVNGFTGSLVAINTNFTLTSSWVRYTATATLNLNTNEIGIQFNNAPVGTAGAADYFEIAQVQLNAGSVALPFQPKSFADELRDCQRYYEKSYLYAVVPGTATAGGFIQTYALGTTLNGGRLGYFKFTVPKRVSGTVTIYPYTTPANISRVSDTTGADLAVNSGVINDGSEFGFDLQNNSGGSITTGNAIIFHYTASSEL